MAAVWSLLSLGIYFLVLVYRWSKWRDALTGGPSAGRWARWGAWLTGASVLAIILGYVLFFAFMFTATPEEPVGPDEEEQAGAGVVIGMFAFMAAILLGFGGFLTGRILLFVAQWRVWSFLQERLAMTGRPPKAAPIALLLVEIFGPQVMQFVVMILWVVALVGSLGISNATGAAPVWLFILLPVFLLLIAAPILWVIYETQKRVLAVAGGPSAHPVGPPKQSWST